MPSFPLRLLTPNNGKKFISLLSVLAFLPGCHWLKLASVDSNGALPDNSSLQSALSGDGRYIAFESDASNLVTSDTNGWRDIFVFDARNRTTSRVSISSSGAEGDLPSTYPSISSNGQLVAFHSGAQNLDGAIDTDFAPDVFVHDLASSTTERVSINSSGFRGNSSSDQPHISGNGRYVAFRSNADNLITGDTNGRNDIFVHDRDTGITSRVSVASSGTEADGHSERPSISDDGRWVAFASYATNLVPNDANGRADIFLHDRNTGTTIRVSESSAGVEADDHSIWPRMAGDGSAVSFVSFAGNLVANDSNALRDVFVRDLSAGITERVSVDSSGFEGNGVSERSAISVDGRWVAFESNSTNLINDDTNGRTDVFVRDRSTGVTFRVSEDSDGSESIGASNRPTVSGDGRYVGFDSNIFGLTGTTGAPGVGVFIRAMPDIQIDSVTPTNLPVGATTAVTITGRHFLDGTKPSISGIQKSIANVVVVDENTITMDVTVQAGASTGPRNVNVSLWGTGPNQFAGSLITCESCVTFF